jgi:octaprenyl-diphosphate synthase
MIQRMHDFGESVGIAFQIKDDLFDYEESVKTGKPKGIDIKEHKMTLPVIYTLQKVSKDDKKFIINTIKHHSEDTKRVEQVIQLVLSNGGLEYAKNAMYAYQQKAFDLLTDIPDSEYKTSLMELVRFTTERNH